jgi:hypothetical protein
VCVKDTDADEKGGRWCVQVQMGVRKADARAREGYRCRRERRTLVCVQVQMRVRMAGTGACGGYRCRCGCMLGRHEIRPFARRLRSYAQKSTVNTLFYGSSVLVKGFPVRAALTLLYCKEMEMNQAPSKQQHSASGDE